MKRILISAVLAAACSSGGAAVTDAGTTDNGTAMATACQTLCAPASCPAGCAAMCEAGGGAVPQCQAQYNSVVRCAAASGQTCMFAQGGGPSCTTQGRAYTDCVAGGATDGGSTPPDADPTSGASIVGRWALSTTAPMFTYELDFMTGPTTGVLRYQSVNTLSGSGCVTTNVYEGTWTRAGSALMVSLTSGTTEVTMCTDDSQNRAEAELPAASVTSVAGDYTGSITVTDSELTFTMFRGSSTRTFTRSR